MLLSFSNISNRWRQNLNNKTFVTVCSLQFCVLKLMYLLVLIYFSVPFGVAELHLSINAFNCELCFISAKKETGRAPSVKYLSGKTHKILVVDGHKFYVKKRSSIATSWSCRLNSLLGWVGKHDENRFFNRI